MIILLAGGDLPGMTHIIEAFIWINVVGVCFAAGYLIYKSVFKNSKK